MLQERTSGILLHLSSLPGPYETGIIDNNAYRFVDFLHHCRFRVWQLLPLCPVTGDRSPYNSPSAFAGNPEFISIHQLYRDFFQKDHVGEPTTPAEKKESLKAAFNEFRSLQNEQLKGAYREFVESQRGWLEGFALFTLIQNHFEQKHWNNWPMGFREKEPRQCQALREKCQDQYDLILFQQFAFFYQWQQLKAYANSKGIAIIGDIPIFVSDNSSDVWSAQNEFKLDEHGFATVVAGVPPDYFSATGQRWGNPLYEWKTMKANGFRWWLQRMSHALEMYDIVRIDHFRGLAASWEIPAHESTAMNGKWVETPGRELLQTFADKLGQLPIIAEDLGIITEDVEALRDDFGLPGMKILQFAFDSDAQNPYLPHNHIENCVLYTGTHDNDTTLGWAKSMPPATRDRVNQYLAWPGEQMPWPLIKCALSSVARLAILPMQDVLILDSQHRMNTPGTTEGNWRWRFQWHQVSHDLSAYLTRLNELYLRA
ncbi:MAG: 4-alpha-glucanotransferase [Ketobacteraceae bacterium]|nr:4-alpha-glucanotransferase [Ketobacteraceae bacterium]